MTLKDLTELIQNSKYPYFELQGRLPYAREWSRIGDNFDQENATKDSAIEYITRLVELTGRNTKGYEYKATLRTTKNSNSGSSISGPHIFTLEDTNEAPRQEADNMGGLSGLGAIKQELMAGLEMQKTLQEPRMELLRGQIQLDADKKELEREKKDFEEYKKEAEAELEELYQKYNSRKSSIVDGLGDIVEKRLPTVIAGILGTPAASQAAGGFAGTQEPETNAELTPEEELLSEMCDEIMELYNEGRIDSTGIEQLCHQMRVITQKIIELTNTPQDYEPTTEEEATEQ